MARKVFISFLGTNKYVETHYKFREEQTQYPVRFIQEALLRLNFKEWDAEDKVFIFCTEKAHQLNWLDNGQIYATTDSEKIGLNSVLLNLKSEGFKPHIESIRISEGFSEEEIWSIFNTVYGVIDESAEIYFDMTHAFRSIPFFSFALFNYSGFLKKTCLKSVYYGAFEKLGSINEVLKMPIEERIAPIFNLKGIVELQQLVIAANNYKKFGKMRELTLSLKATETLSKESKKNNNQGFINSLKNNIEEFEKSITTCRGRVLIKGDAVTQIRQNIQKVIECGIPQPTVEILKSIQETTNKFSANNLGNIYAAIKWCLDYGMIQQAYTFGQEFVITNICDQLSQFNPYKSGEKPDRKFRDYIGSILGIADKKANDAMEWNGSLATHHTLTKSLLQLSWVQALRPEYAKLTANRNQINHGGFTGDVSADSIIKQLEGPLGKCLEIVKQKLELPVLDMPDGFVLINLSNHLYENWSVAQKKAAATFGSCIDLPFPMVDAESDEEAIKELATEYRLKVKQLSQGKEVVVHLMGEMTLTFALVEQLRKIGISCVASTSERLVTEHTSGYKEVLFEFKRFRKYT